MRPRASWLVLALAASAAFSGCGSDKSVPSPAEVAATTPTPARPGLADVEGMAFTRARERLEVAGFRVRRSSRADSAPKDEVVEQRPTPGTNLRPGGLVRLIVSKGAAQTTTNQTTTSSGGTSSGGAAVPSSYKTYSSPSGYTAQVPADAGWSVGGETQPTPGRLYRTEISGPASTAVWIDYTPSEPANFGGSASSTSTISIPALGTGTEYVFTGGRAPQCQGRSCVDITVSSGGAGFGVLAGGEDFNTAKAVAEAIARSLVPAGE